MMGGSLGGAWRGALVLMWGALGCTSGLTEARVNDSVVPPESVSPEPTSVTPMTPVIPTALNTGTLSLESIEDRPTSRVWVAGDGTLLLLLGSGEAVVVDPEGQVVLEAGEDPLFTTVTGIARGPEGALLLGHEGGLSVRVGEEFLPSPLNDPMGGASLSSLVLVSEADSAGLWMSTAAGLWRFWEGEVAEVFVPDFSTNGAGLSFGPVLREGPALWVVADGALYALDSTAGGWSAWPGLPGCDAREAGSTAAGGLWVRCGDTARYRSPAGVWHDLELEGPVARLYTHPRAGSAWLRTVDGRLFRGDGERLWPVEIEELPDEVAVDSRGNLLLGTEAGVVRASPGRGIVFENMPEDKTLVAQVAVTLGLEEEDYVTEVIVTLDGDPLPGAESGWGFILDPPSLLEGAHVVEVVVSYSDTTQVSRSRAYFTVLHPSWDRDVRPISEAHCRSCHGAAGSVSLKLETYEQWRVNAPRILEALFGALMPPGVPLDAPQLDIIRYWHDASSPE